MRCWEWREEERKYRKPWRYMENREVVIPQLYGGVQAVFRALMLVIIIIEGQLHLQRAEHY